MRWAIVWWLSVALARRTSAVMYSITIHDSQQRKNGQYLFNNENEVGTYDNSSDNDLAYRNVLAGNAILMMNVSIETVAE